MVKSGSTWAVIMAGGAGTRFWPLSTRERPKQLLPLGGTDRSLLAETVARIAPIVPPARVIVVTAEHLAEASRAELPELPIENVLAEPAPRNTAPCVGWAAAHIRRRDPEAVLAVLAADHHVSDPIRFRETLRRAIETAESGRLVTIGIRPTRPETGYGYLEPGVRIAEGVFEARRFVEKPSREHAEQLIAAGCLWNSGTFFFRAGAILSAIAEHLPALGAALGRDEQTLRREFESLPSISIDHGVMERARGVAIVPGDFGWSDVGSWTSAWELAPKDAHGNALGPETIAIDARGNYVRAEKTVAILGVEDLVVVDTPSALLVVPRARSQEVRAAAEAAAGRRGALRFGGFASGERLTWDGADALGDPVEAMGPVTALDVIDPVTAVGALGAIAPGTKLRLIERCAAPRQLRGVAAEGEWWLAHDEQRDAYRRVRVDRSGWRRA